jgi:hypothetical protein
VSGSGRAEVNVDTDGDGKPDLNIDTTGNGKPNLNIDTNGDGSPDVNIDTDGDGVADENVDDGSGVLTGVRIEKLDVAVGVSQVVYTAKEQTPAVTVSSGGTVLRPGVDYSVSYVGNVNVGTATATVTGLGSYSGSKQASFQIVPAAVSGLKVTTSAGYAWTGKQVKPSTSSVKVTLGGVALKAGVDYTLSYGANKNIGKGTVKITGKGNLTGSKQVSVKIVPKSNKVSKAAAAKKSVKVAWSKVSKAQKVTKYQLRYRVKGAAKWKTKTFSAKTVKSTVKKLKKGKVYQFQVRSYKTVSKVKYYSTWSKTKASKKVK